MTGFMHRKSNTGQFRDVERRSLVGMPPADFSIGPMTVGGEHLQDATALSASPMVVTSGKPWTSCHRRVAELVHYHICPTEGLSHPVNISTGRKRQTCRKDTPTNSGEEQTRKAVKAEGRTESLPCTKGKTQPETE